MPLDTRRLGAATVLSLVLLAGCGSEGGDPADTAAPATSGSTFDLAGRTFLVTAATGLTLVPDTTVQLSFTHDQMGDQLGISAGCNSMGVGWSLDGNRLVLDDEMASTAMACEQPLMDQDAAIAAFVQASPTVALDGATLTLATPDITLTLTDREVADPDRPLEGTVWTADTLITRDTVSTLPLGATATFTIADGQAAVHTGCNAGSAPVTVTGDTISFGPIALTKVACEGDAAALEQIIVSALSGDLTVAIEAGHLTLTHDDGTGLGFTAP